MEFEATLKKINVRRSFRKGSEFFTYDLFFEKEVEAEHDLHFASYLNQKEENERGQKVLIERSVYLVPLEELMKQ